jgi:ABC-type nitrate/sulfonate/bicarbonate transport system ATPase subunit
MEEKVVLASSLCKRYQIGALMIEALRNLDFEADKGEFVSIYGPSGAGLRAHAWFKILFYVMFERFV